jgi:hypothetical protein
MSFVLLFIGISSGAGGILTRCGRNIYALIVSDGARQLIVALGVKIDELRHCSALWIAALHIVLCELRAIPALMERFPDMMVRRAV